MTGWSAARASSTGLRVGIRIPPCDRVDRLVDTVRRAEVHGFAEAWFPDSQLLWRDVYCTLTAAALGTERIGLGTAVTNVATRHPAVVASAARTVAELAPGRFTLGLGVAGEIADGAILLSGISSVTLAAAIGTVGAAPGFPITVSAYCQVTDDVVAAARQLKPICCRIAQNGGGAFLALAGITVDAPDRIEGVHPDLVHAEDWDLAVRRCEPYVSDEAALRFAQEFCLFGTAPEMHY